MKLRFLCTFVFPLLLSLPMIASVNDITVEVPKTAYLQFIENPTDAMTSTDGDHSFAIDPYVGGPATQLQSPEIKDIYLAIMCNSLAGYEIFLTALNEGATTSTGTMTISGGTSTSYGVSLTKIAASFSVGTITNIDLDLTGVTASASTSHSTEGDLPINASSPNVWCLSYNMPVINTIDDGLIMAGTYAGGVTVTVGLK